MKSRNLYTKFLLAGSLLLMGGTFTSCDDFLTLTPTNQIPEEEFWKEKGDLENVRAGAYEMLAQKGQTEKILLWGEVRSDNFQLNKMDHQNIQLLMNAVLQPQEAMFSWAGFYTGINYCNLILEQGAAMTTPGKEVDPSFTAAEFRSIDAEIKALRSLYYFYLVRSFRDVPFVTKAVRTDKQAMEERPATTPGVAILGQCIDELEKTVNFAPENYGNWNDNKGRFTRLGVHALMADMYLWRAGLLKNAVTKCKKYEIADGRINLTDVPNTNEDGSVASGYKTADGQAITDEYCNQLSNQCLQKAISHADYVLDYMMKEYKKNQKLDPTVTPEEENQPFPMYRNSKIGLSITDEVYNEIFVNQNSFESILELQYDGSNTKNGTANDYFYLYDGTHGAQILACSPNLLANASQVNPTLGWGKTDFRFLESCNYHTSSINKPITKFVQSNVSANNAEDMTEKVGSLPNTTNTNNRHWPIYRLTDVMLIKAEAIARTGTTNVDELKKGFQLVNEIFKRCNPKLVGTPAEASTNEDMYCDRVSDKYGIVEKDGKEQFTKKASDLLNLTYGERQIEFFAEGKRWFDLVRQAEFSNEVKTTLGTYSTTIKAAVVEKLKNNIWGMYNPIYSEELKVNGLEVGGKLVQNPIWDRYTKK